MNILITGGTGFIGSRLVKIFCQNGHQVTILTRQKTPQFVHQAVTFCQNLANFTDLNAFDVVINLAGEPIFDKRWSTAQKQKLYQSRLQITQQLVELIQKSEFPPHTFISGSASGYYGDLPISNKFYDESTLAGRNFTAKLCQDWESVAQQVETKTRVCIVRTGMVLSPEGGALKRMLPLFQKGLGGVLGDGTQYWAWITLADYLNALLFLLNNPSCRGAYNLVAPKPVTNREFTHWLAKFCQKPAYFTTPSCLLKLLLGERAALLLDNQPLYPRKLLDSGFQFNTLEITALKSF